jgi:beta-N-acetylhexosaminidase
MWLKKLSIFFFLLFFVSFYLACTPTVHDNYEPNPVPVSNSNQPSSNISMEKPIVGKTEENTMDHQPVPSSNLTNKIGQMLLVGFRGAYPKDRGVEKILTDIQRFNLGGVILFNYDVALKSPKRNILSQGQVRELIMALKSAVPSVLPLLVAVDQEGGQVQRLKSAGLANTLSAKTLGKKEPTETYSHARKMAQVMVNMGFNLNFAPVVDLDNPNNPIIGRLERSFSDDPQIVTEHALAFIGAHHENGMLCVIKHFPGHGSATRDSHLGLVDVTHSWQEQELEPYRNLLGKGIVDAIMTAHIFHQQWRNPATLSYEVITGILRDELGFQGVVFSDDMQMKAVSQHYGYENAIKMALDAGIDILVIGNNLTYDPNVVERTVGIIEKLIQEGQVTEERINQSVDRIKRLKDKRFGAQVSRN